MNGKGRNLGKFGNFGDNLGGIWEFQGANLGYFGNAQVGFFGNSLLIFSDFSGIF